uniref:Uncharacterized protein n=1 Tax=Setaria digitata TaxID=48799 RepID=A0A915Q4Z7_9BILA
MRRQVVYQRQVFLAGFKACYKLCLGQVRMLGVLVTMVAAVVAVVVVVVTEETGLPTIRSLFLLVGPFSLSSLVGLVPCGEDWIKSAPARCQLTVLVRAGQVIVATGPVSGICECNGNSKNQYDRRRYCDGRWFWVAIGMEWIEKEGELFNDTERGRS